MIRDKQLMRCTPASLDLEATGDGPKRFEAVAYTGSPMEIEGFSHPVVIDLAGIRTTGHVIPILRDHDGRQPVGHTTGISIDQMGIRAEGLISASNEHADEIVGTARNGFQWQVSVGCQPVRAHDLPAGQTAIVNGRTITGPAIIVDECSLREISLVALGADAGTSVAIAASLSATEKRFSMTFVDWVASLGFVADQLTDAQRSALQAVYDKMQSAPNSDPPVESRAAASTIEAERNRVSEINSTAKDFPGIRAEAIASGWTLEETQAACLRELRASRTGPTFYAPHGDSRVMTPRHLAAAIMVRAGFESAAEKAYGPRVLEASKHLHRASLVDLCRTALSIDGRDAPHSRDGMIRAGISTGSMPVALGDSATKILEMSYKTAPAPWRSFAAVRNAANFKEHTGVRPSFFGDLEEVGAGGEIKHAKFDEETYTWQVATYAKQLQISRQDIVNDDLGAFEQVIPALGRSAARTLNDLVATTLLANAGSFFSTGNLNYFDGADSALTVTSMSEAVQLLRQMKDAEGSLLDLSPSVLLVPPELETTGRQLLESTELSRISSTDQLPTGNAFRGTASLAIDPRLSDSTFTGYSTTAWYLFSDPSNAAVIVGFLDGRETPTLETFGFDSDINRLAVGFRVYHDFGVALGDYRAAIKSKGAA